MTTPKDIALSTCRKLMEPIIGILLRNGITHKELAGVCKQLYVKIASQEFGIRGRPTNLSRVALLTGIDRKEVSRIKDNLQQNLVSDDNQTSQDRLTRVLSGWHQDAEFIDENGAPRRLTIEGETRSFAQLARRYGGDMPATALLKELKRHNIVEENSVGELRPLKRYFVPAHSDPSALLRAGSVLYDLGSTLEHNLYKASSSKKIPLRFERRASNIEMSPDMAAAFRTFVDKEGQAFLEKIDAWLTEHENNTTDNVTNNAIHPQKIRLGVGTYLIEDVIEHKPNADVGVQK